MASIKNSAWLDTAADVARFSDGQEWPVMDRASKVVDWPALDLTVCSGRKAPEREWVVQDWMPSNKGTLLAGDGGTGKSLLAQMLATCVAAGRPFLGLQTRHMPAAYLSWEDDQDELWRRQEAICNAFGITLASLAGDLQLVSYTEEAAPFVVETNAEGGVSITDLGRTLQRLLDRHEIGFVALDCASQIAGIDHNLVGQVAPFAHWLGKLIKRPGGGTLLLHHTNKAGQDYLGSVAYNNQFRSRLLLNRPEGECVDPDVRILANPKANYAQAGGKVEFRWHAGAFVRDKDMGDDWAERMAATAAATGDNAAFLACLDARTRDGLVVSPNVSPNYAPAQFVAMPLAKNIGKPRLRSAMERLLSIGEIEIYDHENKGKGRTVKALRRASRTSPNASPDASRTGSRTVPEPTPDQTPNDPAHTPIPKGIAGVAPQATTPASPDKPEADPMAGWGEI